MGDKQLYENLNKLLKAGGAAFPFSQQYDGGVVSWPGMTLRDYFAGQAIATIISLAQNREGGWDVAAVAAAAYAVADAMLEARG